MKTVKMGLLFDFYGSLLTERQREFFALYYEEDWSLGEIAEKAGVSRQAVYDTIKRSSEMLVQYDEKLGLIDDFNRKDTALSAARADLEKALALLDHTSEPAGLVKEALKAISHTLERGST